MFLCWLPVAAARKARSSRTCPTNRPAGSRDLQRWVRRAHRQKPPHRGEEKAKIGLSRHSVNNCYKLLENRSSLTGRVRAKRLFKMYNTCQPQNLHSGLFHGAKGHPLPPAGQCWFVVLETREGRGAGKKGRASSHEGLGIFNSRTANGDIFSRTVEA